MRLLAVVVLVLTAYPLPAYHRAKPRSDQGDAYHVSPGIGERVEMGWTGENGISERHTKSEIHPLSYYVSGSRTQGFLRAATGDCSDPSLCSATKVKVSTTNIKSPFRRRVVQIVYTTDGEASYWKSIVVENRAGLYEEIFLLKNDGGFWNWPPSEVKVLTAGTAKLVVTREETSSRDLSCTGEFWVLSSNSEP